MYASGLSIYGQLMKAAGNRFDPARDNDESDNDYLCRLAQGVSMTTRDAFEAMSETAQLWFDAAADALNEGTELPFPQGYRPRPVPIQSIAVKSPPRPPVTPAQQRVAIKIAS